MEIRKDYSRSGVTTLAGSANRPPGVSAMPTAPGATARFNDPNGMAVTGTTVYVADTYNNTIRKITSTGVVPQPLPARLESLGSV